MGLQYADDIAIINKRKDIRQIKRNIEQEYNVINNNLENIGLNSKPSKTKIVEFSKDMCSTGPTVLNIKNNLIKCKKNTKFLGIFFR